MLFVIYSSIDQGHSLTSTAGKVDDFSASP